MGPINMRLSFSNPSLVSMLIDISSYCTYVLYLSVRRSFLYRIRKPYVCMVVTYSKGKDHPGKVANPARGQLHRENDFFIVPGRA